ncbi:hypothetical protein GCM10009682_22540 [Luedemannella flava]|uniref:Uncharacterized protein n=1 Tax=Luedemannella flava TaxID=349316 RepID=A0ABP4Y8L7_9ACTN
MTSSQWRCDRCGEVDPFYVSERISPEILGAVRDRVRAADEALPIWCPWPLLPGWTVSGVGWVGDDRSPPQGTVVACSGPAPLGNGPADLVLVAERPGTGLGACLAGLPGPDPGDCLKAAVGGAVAHAKVRAAGHPTPLWSVTAGDGRCAYVGEARGLWLYVIAWPAAAGYLLAEQVFLQDLADCLPSELVYGAPSPQLRPSA